MLELIQRKIYIKDSPYPLNNGYMYQSNNGQAINQKMEDNNINNNIKNNSKGGRNLKSNYENQRQYSKEFLESLYANSDIFIDKNNLPEG